MKDPEPGRVGGRLGPLEWFSAYISKQTEFLQESPVPPPRPTKRVGKTRGAGEDDRGQGTAGRVTSQGRPPTLGA